MEVVLSPGSRTLAAILLLGLVAVEWGGTYVLRLVRGTAPATPFQLRFARAGHAHAGVLLVLSLVALLFADAAGVDGVAGAVARSGVPWAAILMPAGFFLSSMGTGRTQPNRAIVLVYLGAVLLATALVSLAIGLLTG